MPIPLTRTDILFTLFFVFLASTGFTWLIYRQAMKRGWLAIPNKRSSHTVPTPTGGGLAIAAIFFASVITLWALGMVGKEVGLALVGGGSMVTLISWIDGRHHLKARVRIVVHALAAIWVLWFLGGLPSLNIGFSILSLGSLGSIIGFFWIVGLSNLYNFMDGIDGLLGAETVMVGTITGLFLMISGASGLAFLTWILAVASAGFLVWNWHPAKIFMGDVGSVLIGFSFATLAIASERAGASPALVWMIILGVVIVDAGLSTLRRVYRREKWFEAHRTFGYHRAVQMGYRHDQVVLRVMGISGALSGLAYIGWRFFPRLLLTEMVMVFLLLAWGWLMIQRRFSMR